jgi:hypothetical protein
LLAQLTARVTSGQEQQGEVFYLWPCNLPAWNLFWDVQTQWRHGFNGPTGLDYQGVTAWMQANAIPGEQWAELLCGVRACERARLEVWADMRAD